MDIYVRVCATDVCEHTKSCCMATNPCSMDTELFVNSTLLMFGDIRDLPGDFMDVILEFSC